MPYMVLLVPKLKHTLLIYNVNMMHYGLAWVQVSVVRLIIPYMVLIVNKLEHTLTYTDIQMKMMHSGLAGVK